MLTAAGVNSADKLQTESFGERSNQEGLFYAFVVVITEAVPRRWSEGSSDLMRS